MSISTGQIRPDLFQINETEDPGLNVDSYVVIGKERAAVIDALQETGELFDAVRRITDLPLVLIITHGHPDHAGRAIRRFHEAGVPVYMHHNDIPLYRDMFYGVCPEKWFRPVEDGQIFDLGGISLKAHLLAGHTPGSIVLLDEKNGRLFSGDAVGSGHFWMQIPGCLPLHEFRDNLKDFMEKTADLKDLHIYPGHRWQSPFLLNRQYLEDTLTLTEQMLRDPSCGEEKYMELNGIPIFFREDSCGMNSGYCFNPQNL